MKRQKLFTLLLINAAAIGLLAYHLKLFQPFSTNASCRDCRDLFPQLQTISALIPDPPHYRIFSRNPNTGKVELSGFAFHTTDLAPDVKGYAGPIDLLVGMDLNGTIVGIKLISHSETSSYVAPFNRLLAQFAGKNNQSPLQLGKDIDGITGATITSAAVTDALRQSLAVASKRILNQATQNSPQALAAADRTSRQRDDVSAVKKKINDARLPLHEALYWRTQPDQDK